MSNGEELAHSTVSVQGHRIAYLDSHQGSQTLLLLHGNPVSSHVFTRLIDRLPARYRCVAPDLLGFGRSAKPQDEATYSLPKHIRIVTEFVQTLELRDVALVAHDWGGPIGFAAALREPDRFTRLIALNTLTAVPMRITPRYWVPFHLLRRIDRLAEYLVRERNLFQRIAVSDMDRTDQRVYFRANDSPANRAGIAAFPRMIPHDREHENFPLLRSVLSELTEWDIPALVLFSDGDNVFSAEQGRQLANRLQNGRFRLVAGAGHFLQYERPDAVAAEIDDFLRETR